MRLLLVDGLNLIRRVYAAVPGEEGTPEHADAVIESSTRSLSRALDEVAPTHALCVLDAGGKSWRHALHPAYKQERPSMPGALTTLLPRIETAFEEAGVRSTRVTGFEADDVIASIAVKVAGRRGNVVILSTDKSMLMLLGEHVRVRHHFDERDLDARYVEERYAVTPAELVTFLALVGDRSHGIPGVRSVGTKTAAGLIAAHHSLEAILAAAPELPGRVGKALQSGADDARLSLRLVTLRTDVDVGVNLKDLRIHRDDPEC